MILTKEHSNKLFNITESKIIELKSDIFEDGDVLILFNNSDEEIMIVSEVDKTYKSGHKGKYKILDFPPRALMNGVFIDKNTVVFNGGS